MPNQRSNINKLFAILAILLISISANVSASLMSQLTQPDTIIQDIYNPQNLNRYSYVLNNPYKYNDPSGNFFDIALDVSFVAWDAYDIVKDPTNAENWVSLGLDLGGAAIPFVAGLGRAYKVGKGLKAADKIIDVGRGIDKGSDALRVTDKAIDEG